LPVFANGFVAEYAFVMGGLIESEIHLARRQSGSMLWQVTMLKLFMLL
jgi:hypothetical protein